MNRSHSLVLTYTTSDLISPNIRDYVVLPQGSGSGAHQSLPSHNPHNGKWTLQRLIPQRHQSHLSKSFPHFQGTPCEPGETPKDNSIIIPPFHAHPNQEEIFLVTSGTALFHLNRKQIPVSVGNEITIPRGDYHKFGNASSTEALT